MWKSVKTPAVTGFLAVYDMGKACSEPARDWGKTKREAARKAQSSVSAAKCGKERKTDALWKKQAKGADCGKAVFLPCGNAGCHHRLCFPQRPAKRLSTACFFRKYRPRNGVLHIPGRAFPRGLDVVFHRCGKVCGKVREPCGFCGENPLRFCFSGFLKILKKLF